METPEHPTQYINIVGVFLLGDKPSQNIQIIWAVVPWGSVGESLEKTSSVNLKEPRTTTKIPSGAPGQRVMRHGN